MIDKKTLAETIYGLLLERPERYRNFGVMWYLVKAFLKVYYDKDRLYLLGDYMDDSIMRRMPKFANADEALAAAMEAYNQNAAFGMGSNEFEDDEGNPFVLMDPDAGM